jgi:hypothetical protein
MKFQTKTILSAADVSSNQTSEVVDLRFNYGFAVQASFTGSPTGSVLVEGSNDQVNWSAIDTLTISGTNLLSSNKDAIYFPFVRVYKAAGGTGTITATITIKGA